MAIEMIGEETIPASAEEVWAALNDPEILKACIPGCESLEMITDHEMAATVQLALGPIKAKFNGMVELTDLDPPRSYTISGQGKGGIAGFAKGSADVVLREEHPRTTVLTYTVRADVGGKIAQLGGRLIQSASKKLAAQFFSSFNEKVGGCGQSPGRIGEAVSGS